MIEVIPYFLIYAVVLMKFDRAAKLSFFAMTCLLAVGHISQQLFTAYNMHFAFDYLAKLIILIPWAVILYRWRHHAAIIIYSASCFEVLMAVDAIMHRGVKTSLYDAYPIVVFIFHAVAGIVILGGRHGSFIGNTNNRSRNSSANKVRDTNL